MYYRFWWFKLEYYEPEEEDVEMADMLWDLKKNVKVRKVDVEGIFAYTSMKDSHPSIIQHIEANIIYFPTTWMVESGFLAVVDVFRRKRNNLGLRSRGPIRLKQNDFIKIYVDIQCLKHQHQGSH